uniref:Uncharacterized protein n=1 Tax=Odontella aurita TaxID=265563 RepID=A0A6U6CET0_9STRA|mmetsp:Transcript_12600/g.37179  ORF Transcript_12600/g.37179 Transcript_12600/m.37179 type:complete len:284 (+) Transcript_12600:176-1027(+)|eukprot:CAMPEP_0113532560 /NCGR_PEP_ID=MMETSP0015_2-20120614/4129_1 /TAXON_ID=2838 /ORGANISM="Odontella" /LENGTH=283 /DNA_ID=CAMNT_0000431539 /DNA_START=165 /DNA_END=1016 /DNA_ORIENTATION=+ /assembly_acc=CAM_ASM_000160
MTQQLEGTWMASNTSFEFPSPSDRKRDERLSRLRRRWDDAVTVLLGKNDTESLAPGKSCRAISDKWFQIIVEKYSEPGRAYHTLVHLEEIFSYLDIILPAAIAERSEQSSIASINTKEVYAAVSLAVFFHDAVYDAKSSTNEEDSAALYREFQIGKDGVAYHSKMELKNIGSLIVHYILATKSHFVQLSDREDPVLLAFLDADMSVLAKCHEAYDAYAGCIRYEYQHVPREVYCKKRAEILEGFASKDDLFFGKRMKELEMKARINLTREVELLRKGIIPNEK